MKTLTCCVWFLLIWLSVPPVHAATGAEAEFVRAYRHYSEGDHSRAKTLFQSALGRRHPRPRRLRPLLSRTNRLEGGEARRGAGLLHAVEEVVPQEHLGLGSLLRVGRTRPGPEALSGSRPRRRCAEGEAVGKGGPGESRALPRAGARSPGQGPRSLRLPPGGAPACAPLPMGRPRPGKGPAPSAGPPGTAYVPQCRRHAAGGPAASTGSGTIPRPPTSTGASCGRPTSAGCPSKGSPRFYRKMRQRDREEQVLRRYVRHYPQRARAGAALTRIATIQWNRDDDAGALETLREFRSKHPGHLQRRYAVYVIGRIHESMGQREAAVRTYRRLLAKEHRYSRFRDDAAWRLAWIHYRSSDYPAARAVFRDIARRPGNFKTARRFLGGPHRREAEGPCHRHATLPAGSREGYGILLRGPGIPATRGPRRRPPRPVASPGAPGKRPALRAWTAAPGSTSPGRAHWRGSA